VAEVNWTSVVSQSGKSSIPARIALVRAMGMAAGAALAQSAFLCFDVVVYGFEAFDAFQTGDFDTFSVNLGLIGASVASIRLQAQAFRALRVARAAVIAGDTAAISKGLDVVPHLGVKLLGLAVVIVGGVIARLYTTDSPLEKWVKNSHFGIRPDNAWSNNYTLSMERLYPILFPVNFEVFRLRELHPYQGQVTSTYLMLNLPGENIQMTDGMIHFKGHEVWRDTLGYHPEWVKKVEWAGTNFDRHIGSRIPVRAGITPYRRVYHEDGVRDLWSIEGKLIYSPREGLTLPTVKIKDWAWI